MHPAAPVYKCAVCTRSDLVFAIDLTLRRCFYTQLCGENEVHLPTTRVGQMGSHVSSPGLLAWCHGRLSSRDPFCLQEAGSTLAHISASGAVIPLKTSYYTYSTISVREVGQWKFNKGRPR